MSAQIISMCEEVRQEANKDWRQTFFDQMNKFFDEVEKGTTPIHKLWEITDTIFQSKSQILGQVALAMIRCRHADLLEQELATCPLCQRLLTSRGQHKRKVETLIGDIPLERPYFYCVSCGHGYYPLDEALGLLPQYSVGLSHFRGSSERPYHQFRQSRQLNEPTKSGKYAMGIGLLHLIVIKTACPQLSE